MANRLPKFLKLPCREKILLGEAVLFDLITGAVLRVVPFRMIPRLYSDRQLAVGCLSLRRRRSPVQGVSGQQSEVVFLVRDALARAGSVSPWRNRCLVSSLTARLMLRRRGIGSELFLGMTKDKKGRTVAHAWLKSHDLEVVPMRGDYIPLYIF